MHAKFASLAVLFSVLFTSQAVGAVPTEGINCSEVFCPAARCPLGKTAEVLPGACCPTCVKCSGVCPEFIRLWYRVGDGARGMLPHMQPGVNVLNPFTGSRIIRALAHLV
ncbi:hypothetical protein K438DRAFT_1972616 [Mycena galopus ATCC 62051]|nr:hypothetical protein K438DRAFT_1972616 [Mycena galopus ATCC 62051]